MIRYAVQDDFAQLKRCDRHISGDELRRGIDAKRVLVALAGDAFAGWLRFSLFWDEIPFLNMLYVLEEYRGKGFGGRLIRRWEEEMLKQGFGRVLTSTLSNERAQFFYRKNGYTDCGALLLPHEPLEIILLKELGRG